MTRPADIGPTLGPLGLIGVDKYLHVLSFAVLAVTLTVALPPISTRRLLVLVIVATVGYGLLVELLQLPLPYRSFGLIDLVADAVGAVLVALCRRGWQALGRPRPATTRL